MFLVILLRKAHYLKLTRVHSWVLVVKRTLTTSTLPQPVPVPPNVLGGSCIRRLKPVGRGESTNIGRDEQHTKRDS
jgi:hypothetical protein